MLYSSRNGCLFYYDSVLYSWQIAEPTLLFLLGLEAVTSYSKSLSDTLTISKLVYYKDIDSVESLEYLEEIYDEIYSFLSQIGSVEDSENYLKFNCYGLKLLLNSLTGTGDDRTVPVIFKTDVNRSLVDPTKPFTRLSATRILEMSFYDLQAQRIYDIFNDIGYDTSLKQDSDGNLLPKYYLDKNAIIDGLPDNIKSKVKQDITTYNNALYTIHDERLTNSEIYRLLDYKAMYAYTLGVLYGCRCLGYSDSIIWRVDPTYWYKDSYFNLVRTAWFVFRFHWTKELSSESANRYKAIQDNKIWNFENNSTLVDPPLASDETACYCLYVEDDKNKSEQILYSFSTLAAGSTHPGSYLTYETDQDGNIVWSWSSIDEKISDYDTLKGIIKASDQSVVRYIGNDPVIIYKAYSYNNDENFLSPTDKNYYVYTGHLGWVDYKEDLIIDTVHNPTHDYLYVVPKDVDKSKIHYARLKQDADSEALPLIVTYYKCYVNDDRNLYGIYNQYIKTTTELPTHFDLILSDLSFDEAYDDKEVDPSGGFIQMTFYDLSTPISLLVTKIDDEYFIWDGDDTRDDESVEKYGYSETPSTQIILYRQNSLTITYPLSVDIRYNDDYDKYWTKDLFFIDDSLVYRKWSQSDNIFSSERYGDSLYSALNKTTNIYKCENKLAKDLQVYCLHKDYPTHTNSNEYIYEDSNLFSNDENVEYRFIQLGGWHEDAFSSDGLYALGITTNVCPAILEDDSGNSFLDEDGNPLVWYDPNYQTYWNGLFNLNRWQKSKPALNSMSLYDASLDTFIPVFVDDESGSISIDGANPITYEEFYSDPTRGIVRLELQVFDQTDEGTIITCYCDTKQDPDNLADAIYCIPGITPEWLSRSEISALGYRFVDGMATLYTGPVARNLVMDNDATD